MFLKGKNDDGLTSADLGLLNVDMECSGTDVSYLSKLTNVLKFVET